MTVIRVKFLDGDRLCVNVFPLNTVLHIKQAIHNQRNHLPQQIRLIYAGKVLEDNHTMQSLGLTRPIYYDMFCILRQLPSNTLIARNDVWLLIKGCTESPNGVSVSKRKGFAGDYLYGMKYDFAHMQEYIEKTAHAKLHNMVSNMVSLTRRNVLDAISETCKYALKNQATSVNIYYTGHGETNTGNWCLSDGVLSLLDILKVYKKHINKKGLTLYLDCCYSGEWALELRRYKKWDMSMKAASWPGKVAYDDKSKGGVFTSFISGRKGVARKDKRLNWCHSKIDASGFAIKYITASGAEV